MSNISIKEMINAGVHFGHQSKYWNPKMRPFIYTTFKKLHIINLEKSITHFNNAKNFIEKITKNNSKILFVGTKRAARDIVSKYAAEAKMPYVNIRWLGGMLTNFDTVKKSIQKLDNLNSQLNTALIDGLTKKESLVIKKQIAKLEKNLSGIKHLEKTPDALFVIDTRYEKIAIQEANKLNIPVIAIVDSNNSSTPIKETKNKSNSSVTKTKSIKKKQIVDTDDTSTKTDEVGVSSKATEDKKED